MSKFLIVSIDCWHRDALSRTNQRFNTPKFDLLTRDYAFAEGIREWCLCDGRHFYRGDEQTGAYVLRDLRHGDDDLVCEEPSHYRAQYRALRNRSAYQQMQAQSETAGEAEILQERLRALGYLD